MTELKERLHDPQLLRDALSIPAYRDRRIAIRELAQPVLERMFAGRDIAHVIAASPLVGTGPDKLTVRHQVSGLRDNCDLPTLVIIIYAACGLPQVFSSSRFDIYTDLDVLAIAMEAAIADPVAFAQRSMASKTGYVFGRHAGMTEDFYFQVVASLKEHTHEPAHKEDPDPLAALADTMTETPDPAKEKATMPTSLPTSGMYFPPETHLPDLIAVLDVVVLRTGLSYADAEEAVVSCLIKASDQDRIRAAAEIIGMRAPEDHPTTEPPVRSSYLSLIREACGRLIKGSDAHVAFPDVHVALPDMPREETAHETILTATTVEEKTMTEAIGSLTKIDSTIASMINAMLTSAKLPTLSEFATGIAARDERLDTQAKRLEALLKEQADLTSKLEDLERRASTPVAVEASHDGAIPSGTVEWKPAHEAFNIEKGKEAFSFKVPVWTWDGVHPHVPVADPHYVFRPFELMRVLYGLVANKRVYLHGHTGTGKTTLIEQVAARLNYPFMRLNFDSEISRMDLIGRDTLVSEGGTTISRFVDGILPQMMQSPCFGCFDEIDFVRPDIAYVMQRMLEGDALVITEDGGRVVKPHPLFRAFATGNTVGQGDEHGMYQGARVQSTALLDRFAVWQRIDYLKPVDRETLISRRVPALPDDLRHKLNTYITEHLEAFTTSKVLQPLSPRGFLALADALVFFTSTIPDRKRAVSQAVEATILDRASVQDRVVLKGLVDRVFG